MGKIYRTKTDIIKKMLECVTQDNPSKTLLMFNSYLSYTQLKSYLDLLLRNKLIELVKENHTYRITENGSKYLKNLNQVDELK